MKAIKYCQICTSQINVSASDLETECMLCNARYKVHFVATTPSLGKIAITIIKN